MSVFSKNSSNFHSVEEIVLDLTDGISSFSSDNSIAFLICDSRIDSAVLVQLLSEKLTMPIVGGTTFTYPLSKKIDEISAAITIFERDGLHVSVAITPALKAEKSFEQVKMCFDRCLADLKTEPKVLIPFIPLMPGFPVDKIFDDLFSNAKQLPVFGGVTTNDLDSTQAYVFANGRIYADSMVLIALGGNVRPVFAVGSQLTVLSEYGPIVTESEGNIVRKVDDMSFCDYMRSIGIKPEDRVHGVDALVQYGPLPCQLRNKLENDDGIAEIRCISYTNLEEGSVAFSSVLPIGTKINMGIIQKTDVVESSKNCMDTLKKNMLIEEKNGYEYSTVLSVPCVARYFAMLGGENLESKFLMEEFSKDIAAIAYYGFCEIGPTQGKDGVYHNRSHNASIVMCAL